MKAYNIGHVFGQPAITSVQIADGFDADHRIVKDLICEMTADEAFLRRNIIMVEAHGTESIVLVLTKAAFDLLLSRGFKELRNPEEVQRLQKLFVRAIQHHHPIEISPPRHESPTPPEKVAAVWASVAIHNAMEGFSTREGGAQ